MKISDIDAWRHVTELWSKHGLKKEEALKFENAKPFIEEYIETTGSANSVDESTIMSIFTEIDEDGN